MRRNNAVRIDKITVRLRKKYFVKKRKNFKNNVIIWKRRTKHWIFLKKNIEKYQNKCEKNILFPSFSLFSIASITFFIENIVNFKVFTYIYDVLFILSTTAPDTYVLHLNICTSLQVACYQPW